MTGLVSDRLAAARRSRLIKRATECALFADALVAEQLPFQVLYLLGPGGVGKTTLLHEFAQLAKAQQLTAIYLDGRHLEPTPELFLVNLQQAMGLKPPQTPQQALAALESRLVLLVDTYELLSKLDPWLRDEFLTHLPSNVLVVLASRYPPAVEWRTDPGWRELMRVLPLRNLTPTEGQLFLEKSQIPAEQHGAILAFTRGHPLALALVADVFKQHPTMHFEPTAAPDIIAPLVERFIQDAPSVLHRQALEACALVRLMTEPLLATLVQSPDAYELFTWLRTLSFIESEWRGLFPHDLVREALTADLRWRHPERYAALLQRARTYYLAHVTQSDSQLQQQALSDYLYLDRDNPLVRAYFEWQESGMIFTDALRPSDRQAILTMIDEHEGPIAARLATHWLSMQPEGVYVLRNAAGAPQGVAITVALEQVTAEARALDPAVQQAALYLSNLGLQQERAIFVRFWLARDHYQAVSPIQSRIFLQMVQQALTTPGLVYTLIACAEPDFWANIFTYINFSRIPAADFTIGGKRYGTYGHDWRTLAPLAWLQRLGESSGMEAALGTDAPPTPAHALLSEAEFTTAVRNALRDLTNPTALVHNPLLNTRLLSQAAGGSATLPQRVTALQQLLRETGATLQSSPRNLKLYRALHHTYFQPAATQEQAAELLDIPFSTYRRHLGAGIAYIVTALWQREIG